MNVRQSVQRATTVFVLALCYLVCMPGAAGQPASTPKGNRDDGRAWIERPWNTRYFISVAEVNRWPRRQKMAVEWNAQHGQTYFDWGEFFDPTTVVSVSRGALSSPEDFGLIVIEFDRAGFVTTRNSHPSPLRGRLNQLQRLALSAGDGPKDRTYDLAVWFTGLGDVSTHWAPAFCTVQQIPVPGSRLVDEFYIYGSDFKVNQFSPTFGCREWAYQLYDDSRPYIDVTSYVPKSKTSKGTYIREFIGWARFGDMKPVIGKHEDTWYCLHDCPNGSKPGAIPDIKAWAASNGWPVPKPPTKAPTFVDPPGRSGTYP